MASPNKTSGLAVVSVCRATICSSWVKWCPPLPPAARGAPPAPGAGVLLSRSTGVRSFSSVQSHIRQRRCSTECPPVETPSRASGRRRLPWSRWGGDSPGAGRGASGAGVLSSASEPSETSGRIKSPPLESQEPVRGFRGFSAWGPATPPPVLCQEDGGNKESVWKGRGVCLCGRGLRGRLGNA